MDQAQLAKIGKTGFIVLALGMGLSMVPTKSTPINFLIVILISGSLAYMLGRVYYLSPKSRWSDNSKEDRNDLLKFVTIVVIVSVALWSIRQGLINKIYSVS